MSHLDLYPTICDVAGIEHPPWLEGTSLLPLVRGDVDEIREEVFAEVTYHAAYEPQRAVRTKRYKYMRRFDEQHPGRVLANVDDGLTKNVLLAAGWADVDPPWEALFDSGSIRRRGTTASMIRPWPESPRTSAGGCTTGWCGPRPAARRTGSPAEGTVYNTVDQVSASDPTTPPSARSLTTPGGLGTSPRPRTEAIQLPNPVRTSAFRHWWSPQGGYLRRTAASFSIHRWGAR